MDGYGYNSKLPDSLNMDIENAMFLMDIETTYIGLMVEWENEKS